MMDMNKIGALHRAVGVPTGKPVPPEKVQSALQGQYGPEVKVLAEEYQAGVPSMAETQPPMKRESPKGESVQALLPKPTQPQEAQVTRATANPLAASPESKLPSVPQRGSAANPPMRLNPAPGKQGKLPPGAGIQPPAQDHHANVPKLGAARMFSAPRPGPGSLAPGSGQNIPGSPNAPGARSQNPSIKRLLSTEEDEENDKIGARRMFGKRR